MKTNRSASTNVEFVHYGPLSGVGGIASVVRVYEGLQHNRHIPVTTSIGNGRLREIWCFVRLFVGWIGRRRAGAARVHIFHLSQGGSFLREGLLLVAADVLGFYAVASLHGSSFGQFAKTRPRLVGFVLRHAGSVLVLTDESRDLAIHVGVDSADVMVVHNPITTQEQVSDLADRPKRVVFAGEVSLRKGADLLADIWPCVGSDWELHIFGPLASDCASLTWPPGSTVVGPVTQADVRQALGSARVAVLPSRAEALPMFILEAMAAGCAVVSTSVGGIPQLLADGAGWSVPPEAGRLAEALVRATSDDEEAQRRASMAHARVAADFSTKKLLEVFDVLEHRMVSAQFG